MEEKSKERYEMKKQLRFLKGLKGRGTELISVYIPPGYAVHEVRNKLREEQGQASNIKSKSTRKNVVDALSRLIHYLKSSEIVPKNGMAIFCGNVSDDPSKEEIELYTVHPVEPLAIQTYRCDSQFFLEPLEDMLDIKQQYGLLVLDGREATFALLRGTNIKILHSLNSTAHSKIRKGGQSANRYARSIEEGIDQYYKRVGENVDKYFLQGVEGMIVGGPGPTKENFMKSRPFNYQIKALGVLDTGYTNEHGIKELMGKASEIISGQEAVKEKKLVDEFIRLVVTGGLATYGEKEVREALESKRAKQLLVSEGLEYNRYHFRCANCRQEAFATGREGEVKAPVCPCGGVMRLEGKKYLVDDLIELADANGIEISVLSTETSEGQQFLLSFYGVGAFLRY